jgi:hypothetical protein
VDARAAGEDFNDIAPLLWRDHAGREPAEVDGECRQKYSAKDRGNEDDAPAGKPSRKAGSDRDRD